jgi:hypothetical protein
MSTRTGVRATQDQEPVKLHIPPRFGKRRMHNPLTHLHELKKVCHCHNCFPKYKSVQIIMFRTDFFLIDLGRIEEKTRTE